MELRIIFAFFQHNKWKTFGQTFADSNAACKKNCMLHVLTPTQQVLEEFPMFWRRRFLKIKSLLLQLILALQNRFHCKKPGNQSLNLPGLCLWTAAGGFFACARCHPSHQTDCQESLSLRRWGWQGKVIPQVSVHTSAGYILFLAEFCCPTTLRISNAQALGTTLFQCVSSTGPDVDPDTLKKYFTSSDPHGDIILLHVCSKFWHSLCKNPARTRRRGRVWWNLEPFGLRFHHNYPRPFSWLGSSGGRFDLVFGVLSGQSNDC